jgi:hypothetical protein
MKKLIGMVDFVLDQSETSTLDMDLGDWYCKELDKLDIIRDYAKLLKQVPNVGMFIPAKLVDGKWVVLEEKENYQDNFEEFEEAKENVIFKGFELVEAHEDYIHIKSDEVYLVFDIEEGGAIDFETQKSNGSIETVEDLVKFNLTLK